MKLALIQFPDTKHTLHMFYIYTDHLHALPACTVPCTLPAHYIHIIYTNIHSIHSPFRISLSSQK